MFARIDLIVAKLKEGIDNDKIDQRCQGLCSKKRFWLLSKCKDDDNIDQDRK